MIKADASLVAPIGEQIVPRINLEFDIDAKRNFHRHFRRQQSFVNIGDVLRLPRLRNAVMGGQNRAELIHCNVLNPQRRVFPLNLERRNGFRLFHPAEKTDVGRSVFHRQKQIDLFPLRIRRQYRFYQRLMPERAMMQIIGLVIGIIVEIPDHTA